ncbi:MAG: hypothetical protein DME92_07255 [Verrucomicrobia bacterium]|nr:MAG: hypothetical protein DME92_07255 [Verrucomicrobiota bacterium]
MPTTTRPSAICVGSFALQNNDITGFGLGNFNGAVGAFALQNNTDGFSNNAFGDSALLLNTTGFDNTAIGDAALFFNDIAALNTAVGAGALAFNDFSLAGTANSNVAVGVAALFINDGGSDNDAVGEAAGGTIINGLQNVAMGSFALGADASGLGLSSANVAIGFGAEAFDDGLFNTVVGFSAGQNLTAGFENIYIGDSIGLFPAPLGGNEVNTIRIGDLSGFNGITQTFVGGIANSPQVWNGVTVCQVTVDFFGHLGVDCVNPDNPGATPQGPGGQSAPVRPGAPGAPQPRSRPQPPARPQFQAMNDKVEKLQATVAQQQKQIETLTAQLREQAAQIQKVSAQVEMIKPAPRVVENR